MTAAEAQALIQDFAHRRGGFAAAHDHVGMSSSQIPDLFNTYFKKLPVDDQRTLSSELVCALLGKTLQAYSRIAGILLIHLRNAGHGSPLEEFNDDLAAVYSDPTHVNVWAESMAAPPNDPGEFKRHWLYAVWLRQLIVTPSHAVLEADRTLLRRAKSEELKGMLGQVLSKI